MFSRRTFSSPIIVALTATLLFVGFASLLPGAVAGTTLRDCTANQAMFFEKPALQYPGAQTYLNVHHGGFLATPTNDVCDGTINFLRCVQGGSFVFSMSSYGTSTANRYSIRMNGVTVVNTAPLSTQQCTQNRNGNNIDGEYSNIDTASYSNVSGLLGTGAPDGGIVSSTMVVTISNSAAKCGLAASQGFQLCNTAQCNSQDIFYGNFQQLQGGLLLKNLVTRRTTSTFWLRFGTADSLSYLSLRYNGAWATSTASTPTFSSSKTARAALFGGGSYPIIQLSGWSSDLTNELIFNISGWQAHMECSETIIVRVGNPGCTLTTRITGDPQFAGLRGQSYQVHGIDGGVYNIISNTQMQLNSRFVFLTGPRDCPEMPSTLKKSSACWTHDGSYLGEIALKTRADDRVLIAPGDAETGFKSVEVNGVQVAVGATVALKDKSGVVEGSLERVSTHELVLRVNLFKIRIENVDGFVNLSDLQVMTHEKEEDSRLASAFLVASRLRALRTHGLLGQTWRAHRFHNHLKVIEGEVDDYLIGSGDMFGDDFMFNRFGKMVEEVSGSESTEEQQDAATVEKQ